MSTNNNNSSSVERGHGPETVTFNPQQGRDAGKSVTLHVTPGKGGSGKGGKSGGKGKSK